MKNKQNKDPRPFSEKHPKWNFVIGLFLLLFLLSILITAVYFALKYTGIGISKTVEWLSKVASKLDAVVIVALITGTVSITGVIISSIVGKSLEYKKSRREYLAQKREKPYADFIAMYYRLLMSQKTDKKYDQVEMLKDMTAFSQELTLWGSNKVVKLWVDYRSNVANLTGSDNLFKFEKILYEIRKDMGFHKMKKGTLLKFFINDFDESIKNLKK